MRTQMIGAAAVLLGLVLGTWLAVIAAPAPSAQNGIAIAHSLVLAGER